MARSFKSSFLTGGGMVVTVDLRGFLRKLTVDFFWEFGTSRDMQGFKR